MGHATVEWVYVGVVISLLTWVGAESWNVERVLEHAPPESEIIKVIGQQWFWTFEHADGTKEIGELHVKKGVPYRFEVVSQDVIHSFNIPDFTILMDAIPGRVNTIWNMFDQTGEYLIQCREYCGLLHYNMKAKLFVEEPTQTNVAVATETANQSQSTTSGTGIAAGNASSSTSAATTTTAAAATLTIPVGAATPGNPSYDPLSLTVKKGDVIDVVNKDSSPHTVTSGKAPDAPDAGKQFDTSIVNVGASAKVATANLEPGEYDFHCAVHPFMMGKIIVQ
ncbi:MAG TPA: cupredoxin domain-containing protein [Nitrososphaeraceae archaeon]|nr:cupredoxin domain-containing protein [Nitrososphaeraceae archaeon]